MRKQLSITLFCVVFFFSNHTFSASLLLSPSSVNAMEGDIVSLDLLAVFSDDPTLGGGIDIFYDQSVLRFDGFSFDTALDLDAGFSRQPDVLANELEGIAFGNFNGISDDGRVGTLTFTAISESANSPIDIAITDNALAGGPFISGTDFTTVQTLDLTGSSVSVSAVPLPAAVWLFGSALGLLTFKSRSQKFTKHSN